MRVETRVCFAVYSEVLSPADLAARIGAAPTASVVRGSRRRRPPVPVANRWSLESGLGPEAALWRHLEALLPRVSPLAEAITALCADEPTCGLTIVREFTASDQEADLGFWLDENWLALLHRTGATIEADEYDYGPDEDSAASTAPT
ncbi:DUF4279 domain-containing protein [Cryptosporangium japonicum]|uniref:DUF4279 domain-containing protein n=1 Tax=Cryptosporangium japonicum TaxID=80872 RepID=A0ABN0UIC1_9ACTN